MLCETYYNEKLYDNYRDYLNKNYFHYLLYTSSSLLIPTLCSIYYNSLDHFFLIAGTFLTSILRWGFPFNKFFMTLDHTFVKFVFIAYCIYAYISFNKTNDIYVLIVLGCLLNIFVFYILGCIAFHYKNNLNIPLHIIVHINTMFGFLLSTIYFKTYWKFF